MFRPVAAAALLIAACGPRLPERVCTQTQAPPASWLAPGPATVWATLAKNCNFQLKGFAEPNGATVHVFGPDGLEIPSKASAPLRREQGPGSVSLQTIVDFEVRAPGVYRVHASFEPGLGQIALDILAPEMVTDAGAREVALPGPCLQYGVSAQGTVICAHAHDVITEHGQKIEGDGFALRGDVLWRLAHAPLIVERFVEDAGVFVRTHAASPGVEDATLISAFAGDGWVEGRLDPAPSSHFLARVHAEDDGGVTIERRATGFDHAQAVLGAGALWTVLSVDDPQFRRLLLVDGGTPESLTTLGSVVGGAFVGSDEDRVWLQTNGTVVASGVPTALTTPPIGVSWGTPPPPLWPFSPMLATGLGTQGAASVRGGAIEIRVYDPGARFLPPTLADPRHVFALSLDAGSVLVIDR